MSNRPSLRAYAILACALVLVMIRSFEAVEGPHPDGEATAALAGAYLTALAVAVTVMRAVARRRAA